MPNLAKSFKNLLIHLGKNNITDLSVKRINEDGDLIVASEACGGVIESNVSLGTDTYIADTLGSYILSLGSGVIELVEEEI